MILYLESVDRGLALAHITYPWGSEMHLQSSDVIAHQWQPESAELICHLEILGDKMSILLLLNHDTQVYKQ